MSYPNGVASSALAAVATPFNPFRVDDVIAAKPRVVAGATTLG
jgi:hypothetical protein